MWVVVNEVKWALGKGRQTGRWALGGARCVFGWLICILYKRRVVEHELPAASGLWLVRWWWFSWLVDDDGVKLTCTPHTLRVWPSMWLRPWGWWWNWVEWVSLFFDWDYRFWGRFLARRLGARELQKEKELRARWFFVWLNWFLCAGVCVWMFVVRWVRKSTIWFNFVFNFHIVDNRVERVLHRYIILL